MNIPATFEVRSLLALPVPELIGGGGWVATSQKLVRSLAMPTLSILPPPIKNPMPTVQTIYICAVHLFSHDVRSEFSVGVANPQSWERGGRRGVGDGTVRKSVGEFL